MNADQVIVGIGKALSATKPAQEYCLFWSDYWWWMCMTKAEWSGWVQAIGVSVALALPWMSYRRKISKSKSIMRVAGRNVFNWNLNVSQISKDLGYGIAEPEKLSKAFAEAINKKNEFVDFSNAEYEAFQHLSTYHSALLLRCVQEKSQLITMLEFVEPSMELARKVKKTADSLIEALDDLKRGIEMHTYSWLFAVLSFFLDRPYRFWTNFIIRVRKRDLKN